MHVITLAHHDTPLYEERLSHVEPGHSKKYVLLLPGHHCVPSPGYSFSKFNLAPLSSMNAAVISGHLSSQS